MSFSASVCSLNGDCANVAVDLTLTDGFLTITCKPLDCVRMSWCSAGSGVSLVRHVISSLRVARIKRGTVAVGGMGLGKMMSSNVSLRETGLCE